MSRPIKIINYKRQCVSFVFSCKINVFRHYLSIIYSPTGELLYVTSSSRILYKSLTIDFVFVPPAGSKLVGEFAWFYCACVRSVFQLIYSRKRCSLFIILPHVFLVWAKRRSYLRNGKVDIDRINL